MTDPKTNRPKWALPYTTDLPTDPTKRKRMNLLRTILYIVLAVAFIVPIIQLQTGTVKNHNKYQKWLAAKEAGQLTEAQLEKAPKRHKGAVNRWRKAVVAFWKGDNIYVQASECEPDSDGIFLHPNMPFVVILLTPFAYLPWWCGGLVFTILKVLVAVLAGLMATDALRDRNHRMPEWLVGLGVAWWITLIISDLQHANTNGFVLFFIVWHIWLAHRGKDFSAGAVLAVAVCIKMTPALLVVYWLYQRNWKLLAGCATAGLVCAIAVPAALVGPERFMLLTRTWLNNLIFAGLGGAWYPIHVNQSISGVLSRLLLGGHPGGNIEWNPDDNPYNTQTAFEWIAITSNLSEMAVKRIIQACQAVVVLTMAWAIGWKKLGRTDARRGLHFAMVIPAILLLNQRTWDHHAATMLPAYLAMWYAIAFGRITPRVRKTALALMIASAILLWASAGESLEFYGKMVAKAEGLPKEEIKLFAQKFADRVSAYGPKFLSFLLSFITAAVLAAALKKSDKPYAETRQPLNAKLN